MEVPCLRDTKVTKCVHTDGIQFIPQSGAVEWG